jgi:RNA polymerase sigma-70 factor, ECF subfamily
LPDAEDPSMAPSEPVSPDVALDAAQDESRLRAALLELPPEQAEVIRLAYYEDRPHVEIERALGIPLGTVKSRLRLAMARLRARLTEPTTEGGTR